MRNHALLLIGIVSCSLIVGCQNGPRLTFLLEWEGVDTSSGMYPPALVLEETRVLRVSLIDGPLDSRFERAKLSVVTGNRFLCDVPKFGPGVFVAPFVATDREYRFTVYTPGHVAVTVYPLGVYNVEDPASRPTLLRAYGYNMGTHFDAKRMEDELPIRQGPRGEELFIVQLRRIHPRRPATWPAGSPVVSRRESLLNEIDNFYTQITSLEQAISAGLLAKVDREQRRVLGEAIRLEYESLVWMQSKHEFMAAMMKKPYERILTWAAR